MIRIAAFILLLLLVAGYARRRGGAPEKIAAVLMVMAMFATLFATTDQVTTFESVQWTLLWIDLLLLLGLTIVAVYADRYWPMLLAATQLVAVASHGASSYTENIIPVAYWWIVSKISYPMVALLAIGTRRHHLRKLRGHPEFGWTPQRHRARATLDEAA